MSQEKKDSKNLYISNKSDNSLFGKAARYFSSFSWWAKSLIGFILVGAFTLIGLAISITCTILLPIITLSAYSFIVYLFHDYIRSLSIRDKYVSIDREAERRDQQRQRSLTSTYTRVKEATNSLVSDAEENSTQMSRTIERLSNITDLAEKQHHELSMCLPELNVNQLHADLKDKTDQLTRITEEYEALKIKFSEAIGKIEEELIELKQIEKSRWKQHENEDYSERLFDIFTKLKSTNADLARRLRMQTAKYEQAEQQIIQLTELLNTAKSIIQTQEVSINIHEPSAALSIQ